jgi:acyl-CoA thioesterase-1
MKWLIAFLFSTVLFAETKIVFIGDSLTEGFGVATSQAYPTLLKEKLDKAGKPVKIYNGGISGSTTAGAAKRVQWFLKEKPDYIVLALGANDGLRGLKPQESEKNLDQAIKLILKNKIKVILAGIEVPPNYGKKYQIDFKNIFSNLAKKNNVIFYPFLLKDVGGIKELNQSDGIHPNEKGYEKISQNLFDFLKDRI